MSNLSLLPETVKKLRNLKGWKQRDLAEKTNLSTGVIGKLESGESFPRYENLIAIADALEVSLDELFNRKGYSLVMQSNVMEDPAGEYRTERERKLLDDLNELKDQAIKRLEREVLTYKNHIERQDKMIEMLQRELEDVRGRN